MDTCKHSAAWLGAVAVALVVCQPNLARERQTKGPTPGLTKALGKEQENLCAVLRECLLARGTYGQARYSMAKAAARRLAARGAQEEALAILCETLRAGNYEARLLSVAVLGDMGPSAGVAVPGLVRILANGQQAELKQSCALALGQIRRRADLCVPALAIAAGGKNPFLRGAAVRALGEFGGQGKDAVDVLKRIAREDPAPNTRVDAAAALWQITHDSGLVLPVFKAELAGGPAVREALAGLAAMGAEAAPALGPVVRILQNPDPEDGFEVLGCRAWAAVVIAKVGPEAKRVLPQMIDALGDQDGYVVSFSTHAILRIGAGSVDPLAAALSSPKPGVRRWAAATLGQLGDVAAPALPALRAALGDPQDEVRREAQRTIEKIREKARSPG